MKRLLPCLAVVLALLAPALAGQGRPRSADAALAAFQAVADRPEGERRRAVRDLGPFADSAVTALLLRELARAREPGYQQDVARALGRHPREGSVGPLQEALAAAANPRVAEALADALGQQGDPGIAALGRLLGDAGAGRVLRGAVLHGLGRAPGTDARALLCEAAAVGAPRDRTAALRELRSVAGDAAVDALRVQCAGETDWFLSGEALDQLARHGHAETMALAVQIHRRTNDRAPADVQAAILRGLLAGPESAEHGAALLQRAALAEDPFAADLEPQWRGAIAQPALAAFVVGQAPKSGAPPQRAAAACLLGWIATPPAAAALTGLLRDKETSVVAAAAAALVTIGGPSARKALEEAAAATDARAVPALLGLQALRRDDPDWPADLARRAGSRDPAVRTAVLHLLAELGAADGLRPAVASLDHKAWNVRGAAIGLLAALRDAAAIPPLIARVGEESGRLHSDLLDALMALTGQRFQTRPQWEKWWREQGAGFAVPPPRPAAERRPPPAEGTVSYFNLPVVSERVAFVLDTSGSMNQPMGTGGLTRFEEAVRQLERVLQRLPAKTRFCVVTFGNRASVPAAQLVPLDERSRAGVLAELRELSPGGATNVHDGLRAAFADADVDTIFLLTDGRPSAGPVVEPGALARVVREWNLARGVQIHTVSVGERSELLATLARESGGDHTVSR